MQHFDKTLKWQGHVNVDQEKDLADQIEALPESRGLYALFGYHVVYSPAVAGTAVPEDTDHLNRATRFEETVLLYIGKADRQSIRKRVKDHCQQKD